MGRIKVRAHTRKLPYRDGETDVTGHFRNRNGSNPSNPINDASMAIKKKYDSMFYPEAIQTAGKSTDTVFWRCCACNKRQSSLMDTKGRNELKCVSCGAPQVLDYSYKRDDAK